MAKRDGNTLYGFIGLGVAQVGVMLSLPSAALLLGSTILTNLCGFNMFAIFQTAGLVGVILGLIMIAIGVKIFLSNQTKVIKFIIGLLGLELAVISAVLAAVTVETIIGAIFFAVLVVIGVSFVDIGWNTRLVRPISAMFRKL